MRIQRVVAILSLPVLALAILAGCSSGGWHRNQHVPEVTPEQQAAATLDAFHAAAARADEVAYFDLLTDDAVFLGTDPAERWPKEAFRAWSAQYFAGESAWTYRAVQRNLTFSPRGDVAWFDEVVHNEKYGDLRGSGVLVRNPHPARGTIDHAWKIAQYNLTFMVPNDLSAQYLELVGGH